MSGFAGQSLSARIALASGLVALATGLVVALFGYFVVSKAEDDARLAWAADHMQQNARRVEDRLGVVLEQVRSAASSPLIYSALVDSAGKELYLQPHLNSLSIVAGVPVSVHFVDFAGDEVMSSDQARPAQYPQAWLRAAMQSGRDSIQIVETAGEAEMYYVVPVKYARTERTEGALIAHLRLDDLVFDPALGLSAEPPTPLLHGAAPTAHVSLPAGLLATPLRLELSMSSDGHTSAAPLPSRAWSVLAVSTLLSLAMAYALARLLSRRAVADLDRLVLGLNALSTQADAVRRRSRLEVVGPIEIQSVSRGVNQLLSALERSNEEFRIERELRMAGIIESSTDAIISLNGAQRIVQFNSAASQMFRVPSDEMLGDTIDRFIPPVHRHRHAAMVEGFAKAPLAAGRRMGPARSFTALRADGDEFTAEAMLTKATIEGELYMTVVIRDITDQINAESERAARNLAEAANREKTAFLARMSHELRTPLNAIHGFAELMMRESDPDARSQERQRLELIVNSSRHLMSLINDLLDVSRIELGALDVEVASTEVAHIVRAAIAELEAKSRLAGVAIAAAGLQTPLWAMADATRMHQIVSNLLSNAIKYNRKSGTVRVELTALDEWVSLTVADTGIGMTPAQLQSLYEPFNRLGRTHASEGTGIGLVITKHLVEGMGGKISVTSVPLQGTRFDVLLRRGIQLPDAPVDSPAQTVPQLTARHDLKGRVLYVEDDPVNQILMESYMGLRPGVQLMLASDGATAVELVCRDTPDLVIVDMMLPDMHGCDVARALTQRLGSNCPPLIAFSANALTEDIATAMNAGFRRYLIKPAATNEVLAIVDEVLGRHREFVPAVS